jgi:hypothetical protein
MKAVMPVVPPDLLEWRKRTGAHRWDEMWKGVWHLMPSPNRAHQDLEGSLEAYLRLRWARPRGAKVYHQINLASPGGWPDDYRIPDLLLLTPEHFALDHNEYFEGAVATPGAGLSARPAAAGAASGDRPAPRRGPVLRAGRRTPAQKRRRYPHALQQSPPASPDPPACRAGQNREGTLDALPGVRRQPCLLKRSSRTAVCSPPSDRVPSLSRLLRQKRQSRWGGSSAVAG